MKKFFENTCSSGKGRQSLIYIYVMRIRKMLISYVKLDHTLYSIKYDKLVSMWGIVLLIIFFRIFSIRCGILMMSWWYVWQSSTSQRCWCYGACCHGYEAAGDVHCQTAQLSWSQLLHLWSWTARQIHRGIRCICGIGKRRIIIKICSAGVVH